MRGIGAIVRSRSSLIAVSVVVLIVVLAAAAGVSGCGAENEVTTTAAGATRTTAAATATTAAPAPAYDRGDGEGAPVQVAGSGYSEESAASATTPGGALAALEGTSGQKVISDALVEIEVEAGKFEAVFDQALLLADRYGGYLVSSASYAAAEGSGMRSGSIAIRVPATSFTKALADAGKLGVVKNRQVQTQDVTEEYVDLQARIANSDAHVKALLALLAKAKTVDDILQVQQVLTSAQQQLEELKGRLRYLDEHTSYSTLTMSIYEAGVILTASTGEWGFTQALKDAVRNLVQAVNAIVRGLGVVVPILVILAIIAYIVYRIWRAAARRRREEEARSYQRYPEGWHGPATASSMAQAAPTATTTPTAAPTATTAGPAPGATTPQPETKTEA